MSTDLSRSNFPDQSKPGFLSALAEAVRPTLRDAARAVRMEAAWNTWPLIHRVSKALQERLTTDHDIAEHKAVHLTDLVQRLEHTYLSPERFPPVNGNMQEWREKIALNLGMHADGDIVSLDEVIAAYEAKNGPVVSVAEEAHLDVWEQDMDDWSRLNQAVGGDLFTNPAKHALLQQIDRETSGAPWDEFHARVVDACSKISARDVSPDDLNPKLG